MFDDVIQKIQIALVHQLLQEKSYTEAFQLMNEMRSDIYLNNYGLKVVNDLLEATDNYHKHASLISEIF